MEGVDSKPPPSEVELKRSRGLRSPLIISGTIKASQMKLSTVIVLLKAYQNTKRIFKI